MEGWTLVLLLLGADPVEERRYPGFASQDECLRNAPLYGPSVSNWGTLSFVEPVSFGPAVTAVCVPVAATLECPPVIHSADLDGSGTVNANDFNLFMEAFERGTP